MLAISCSTSTELSAENRDVRSGSSVELDRAERGETQDREDNEEESVVTDDDGYEHITVRVGVVETIRSLWNNETPVLRMRQV